MSLCIFHSLLPIQNKLDGINDFSTIVEKSGAYREAFADPVYAMDGQRFLAMTTTTKEGAGNIYKVL